MSKWLVEGTCCASFKLALAAAQILADSRQVFIPITLERGNGNSAVVRMVGPR